jgi:ketosteroid isomerase-like protein
MRPVTALAWLIGALLAVGSLNASSARAQRADPNRAGAAAIMRADADFNQAVADRDLKRFLSFVGEPTTFNGGMADEIHSRDAIAKDWAPYFDANGPRLAWKPIKGEILGHGDLGYTVGTWERRAAAAGGQAAVTRGNYLTVWRKQADGAWRVSFDTGSSF